MGAATNGRDVGLWTDAAQMRAACVMPSAPGCLALRVSQGSLADLTARSMSSWFATT